MVDEELGRRLDAVVEQVLRIAEGDHAPAPISHHRDRLDAIVSGLNMLCEEIDRERERRERAEELLQDAVDAYEDAPGLFCSIDDASREIVKCNRALCRTLGRTKDELLGTDVLSLHSPECREDAARAMEAVERGEEFGPGPFELLDADGQRILVRLTASGIGEPGERRLRLIWRDVTTELRLERQLVQAQKMEAVGRLAGGIAHDFNNLLVVIMGNTDLAQTSLDPGHPALQDLREIKKASARAAEMVAQLLAFSRRQVVALQDVDLDELLVGMRLILERALPASIRLEIQAASEPTRVRVDPGRFEQVLLNLALNARDAMPDGGVLRLVTGRSELPEGEEALALELPSGQYRVLEVSDTGTGIPEDVLPRVLEPFFTTKPVGKGSGLGLSMCHGIIRQFGGALSLSSRPGEGTRVRIHLPSPDS